MEHILTKFFSHAYTWIGGLFAPTTIIAFIVLFVGLQQYSLAKEKLRLDSYDKRFKLFELTRAFTDLVQYMHPQPGDEYLNRCSEAYDKFTSRCDDALFLFKNSDIHRELIFIRIHGAIFLNKQRGLQELYNNTPPGTSINTPRNLRDIRSADKYKTEIMIMGDRVSSMFFPYLVIVDSPSLIIFPEGLLEIYNNKKLRAVSCLNMMSRRYLNFNVFPISKHLLIIIAMIESIILVCLWIIID